MQPFSFTTTWQKNSDINPSYADDYFVPPANLTFFERFPLHSHTLPKVWNNAGTSTFYNNPTTFKIALNDDLFNGNEVGQR